MSLKANCSHDIACKLAALGAVRAVVQRRAAVVTAVACEPTTLEGQSERHVVCVRFIDPSVRDLAAEGTRDAEADIQAIVDRLTWKECE